MAKRGRPKKTTALLPDGWQQEVLALYEVGASDVEIRALLSTWIDSFSDALWYRWMEEEPEFSGTVKRGRKLSESWWLRQGRDLRDKDLNHVLWYMNMKNRFGWADKQEVKQDVSGGISINLNITDKDVESDPVE